MLRRPPITQNEREKIFEEMVSQREQRDAELWAKYSVITQIQKAKPMTPDEQEKMLQELIKERELRDQELSAKITNKIKK